MILSLDMSTKKTGFSIWNENKLFKYGVIEPNINSEQKNKETVLYERVFYLYTEIKNIMEQYDIKECVFEDVPISYSKNLDVAKWLCIIQGVLTALCYRYNIQFVNYHPQEWRKKCDLLKTKYICKKCGEEFLDTSSLIYITCPHCENNKVSTFSKIQINDRYSLKERAIDVANKKFGLNLVYKNKTSKLNDDDIAEAILIGYCYILEKRRCDING